MTFELKFEPKANDSFNDIWVKYPEHHQFIEERFGELLSWPPGAKYFEVTSNKDGTRFRTLKGGKIILIAGRVEFPLDPKGVGKIKITLFEFDRPERIKHENKLRRG